MAAGRAGSAPAAAARGAAVRPPRRAAPVSRPPRLLWGTGSLVLALLVLAAVARGTDLLLLVVALLWFALTQLIGPHTWDR